MTDPPIHQMWTASSYDPDRPTHDRRFDWKRFFRLLQAYRLRIVTLSACILLNACLGVVPSLLAKSLIDGALAKRDWKLLVIEVACMVLVAIASSLVLVYQGYLNVVIGQGVVRDVRSRLIAHLMRMPIAFFSSSRTGELMNRVSNDIERLDEIIADTAVLFLTNAFTIVTTIFVIFALDWRLSLVALSILPLMVVPLGPVGRRMYGVLKQTRQRRDEIASITQATLSLSGIILVKSFVRRAFEQTRFRAASDDLMEAEIRMATVGRSFAAMVGALVVIGPSIVWIAGGYLAFQGNVSVGTIIAFVALIGRLYGPAASIATTQAQLVGAHALLDRIFEYSDLEAEAPGRSLLPEVRGEIAFEAVSFQYSTDRRGVDDVSFHVKAGQFAAFVGPSGAGKTTIAQLIGRFYEHDVGKISLDSVDIKSIALESLRSQIGFVTQETYLFHDTIEHNIRYGRESSTAEQIEAAARAANAYDFIAALPLGFQTIVGERGHALSSGERQRIAIARVLLKDARILILDEATSALDSANEHEIQAAVERAMEGRTSIVIAHRLSTVVNADVIFVMDNGRIVERGAHSDLISKGGLYAKLREAQIRAAANAPERSADAATRVTGQ